jgi:PAS domain S-box-containing protein
MSLDRDDDEDGERREREAAGGEGYEGALAPNTLRVAVEHAYDAVVITTADLDVPGPRILYVNRAFTTMTGYRPEEVVGRTPRILQGPKTSRRVLDRLRRELDRGKSFRGRAVNYRKNGSEFWLEWRVAPVWDHVGRITHFVAVQRDVTASMRARARRAQARAELERLVEDRTSKLAATLSQNEELLERERLARHRAESTHARLEREARAKDEFLAMLAHELRNPLASITAATQLMKLQLPASSGAKRACGVLERQTAHLVRLVDDLLDTARLTTGRIALREREVELRAVVEEAVEAHRSLIEERSHHLIVRVPDECVVVFVDPTRLVQAIGNLVANAARYTRNGGQILVAATLEGESVAIRVRDNGIGIPPEKLDEVFDLFMQADRDLARTQGGLGLGLALTRRLIELHGGHVEVRSEGPGAGSEFTIRLPADRLRRSRARHAGSRATRREPSALRILVVEDDRDVREALAMLLSARGHVVQTAEDGPRALQQLSSFAPQIALVDIGLPGMDGYELAGRMRAANGRNMRVVAVSGYGRARDIERSRAAGFDAHLVKPVTSEDLEEELTQATRGR